VTITAVATGKEALGALEKDLFDCMVLDLALPDMSGFDLLKKMQASHEVDDLPVIVYTARELTRKEETELAMLTEAIIVKGVRSHERLLAETALFLHRVHASLPEPKRQLLERVRLAEPALSGRKVLVVDDDVRNIVALTSLLESRQMDVLYAESGKDALGIIKSTPNIDVVLMDVMMPE